jgi:septal ring factor EnvC (AmiA/AmiB activator)
MDGYRLAVREGLRNFRRAQTLSLALMGCIAVAVFAMGALGLTAMNIDRTLEQWESRVELVVFLSSEIAEREASEALAKISGIPLVGDARLVSGRETWEELLSEAVSTLNLGGAPLEEVLPATVIVRMIPGSRDLATIRLVADEIVTIDGVDEVKFEEVLLERYMRFRDELSAFTTGTSALWIAVFGIITVSIARLASAARGGEVQTLSGLGASKRFVRRIFLVEGAAQGLAGSILGTAALLVAAAIVSNRMSGDIALPVRLFATTFVVGPILGMLSSWFSLRSALAATFAVLALVIPAPALAQENASLESEIIRYREELSQLEEKLGESRGTTEKLELKELAVLDEVERLDKEMEKLTGEIARSEQDIIGNREAVETAKADLGRCEEDLEQSKQELGQWLRLLVNQREPTMIEVILQDIPQSEITVRREMISRLVEKEAEAFGETERLRKDFVTRQQELNNRLELDLLYTEAARLRARQSREKRKQREVVLTRLRAQRDVYAAVTRDLETSAHRLETLIDEDRKSADSVFTDSVPFRDMKGLLPWPVGGNATLGFGRVKNPDSHTYTRHRGLDLEAAVGTEVRAVHDATVVYSDWFRGYGKIVILSHGGGYNSVYAHCSEVLVQKGDIVRAGLPVALAGETGSLKGPFLYFEIREDGKPVDPALWLQRRNLHATQSK